MISSFLKQRFGELVRVSHSPAAEPRSQQSVVESCLIDTCISTCLTPGCYAPECPACPDVLD